MLTGLKGISVLVLSIAIHGDGSVLIGASADQSGHTCPLIGLIDHLVVILAFLLLDYRVVTA